MKNRKSLPNICLLTENYYPLVGGAETQTRLLAENLAANGFKVFIVTRRVNKSLKPMEQIAGITVYRIPPVGSGARKRWGMLLWSLGALAKMARHYDIIFVSGFKALGISAVLVSKLLRKRCILKADSNGEMSGEFFVSGLKRLGLLPSSLVVRMFIRVRNRILRAADSFVAITTGIAEELRIHGVNPRVIHSITNGVDTRKFCPVSNDQKYRLRGQLTLPDKEIIVTYTGRLVSYKGLPLLMRVAEKIQRQYKNVGFVFVGSGGIDIHACEAELKDYAVANGLETTICFAGDVQNVHEYLQASDLFVFPTEKDAFPLALIEAMACGLPIITTPAGGIKEIIIDRQNGLVVEPGNFQKLYEALDSLIIDHTLATHVGQGARQTVVERYSARSVTAKYIEVFRHASFQS